MLAFTNRFHGHGSLKYVYKNGAVLRSRLYSLKYCQNKRRHTPRIAVVVSKKVLKSAVGRNRIRRRLYEYIRIELPNIKPDSDIVLIVFSRDVATVNSNELQKSLQQILTDAHLYK